jgi:hypothetical protein
MYNELTDSIVTVVQGDPSVEERTEMLLLDRMNLMGLSSVDKCFVFAGEPAERERLMRSCQLYRDWQNYAPHPSIKNVGKGADERNRADEEKRRKLGLWREDQESDRT